MSIPMKPIAPLKVTKEPPRGPDFRVVVDEDNGAITIMSTGYRFNKSITLTIDELPDRYQTFFATYLLCKER